MPEFEIMILKKLVCIIRFDLVRFFSKYFFEEGTKLKILFRGLGREAKLYIPSTLNIDLILWHTQLIVCAENVKSWSKSWVFPFTF